MQQILIIHGGEVFDTQEEYLEYLRAKDISLDRLRQRDWKRNLQNELGDEYEVFTPRFPNAQNARYAEWKIIFDKLLPLFDDNLILIGHSLGGIFLLKYLSENTVTKKIKATLLVAPPYSTPNRNPIADFVITEKFDNFYKQAGRIRFYHSQDDPVVPFDDTRQLVCDVPYSGMKMFTDRGHFTGESFPEIIEDIKNLDNHDYWTTDTYEEAKLRGFPLEKKAND